MNQELMIQEFEDDWQQQQAQDEHAQREYIRARVLAIGKKIGSGMTTDRDQQEYLELMRIDAASGGDMNAQLPGVTTTSGILGWEQIP